MQLIYLSPVTWTSFAQRPHKFVEWFHANTGSDVLWIDPYPTRFPLWSDFKRLKTQKAENTSDSQSWLKVIRVSALPLEPLPGSGFLNDLMWARWLEEIEKFSRQSTTLLAIGKPSVFALVVLKRLKTCCSLYDAMDDFPAFYTGISGWSMCRREEELASRVNIVLVSSTTLKQRWSKFRGDVLLVHNGLDLDVLPEPRDRATIEDKKVFGYVGTIASWFDWEWLIELARARPADVVRLIGPVFSVMPSNLPQNIEILPSCSHADALLAMRGFDVGLIPFKKNNLTLSVDPIKYYEYRALGMPVISTDFGEMAFRDNEEGTFISLEKRDIAGLVEKALSFKIDYESVKQFAICNSWNARFNVAKFILNSCSHPIC